MERTDILDAMGTLKLYGMKAAYDEIVVVAVKRQHEPQRVIGDLLTAELGEKQARSIKYQMTIAKLPFAKEVDEFVFDGTPINETLVRELAGGGFLAHQRNLVLIGGTGTGKTHIAVGIARSCNRTLASLAGHLLRNRIDPWVAADLLRAWNHKAAAAPGADTTATDMQPAQVVEAAPPVQPAVPTPATVSEAASAPQSAEGASLEADQHAPTVPASPMPVVTAQPTVQQPTAQVIDLDDVRADERRATLAYVSEVHELCAIAGRGDLAAGFIAKATPVTQIRRALLESRAAEDEATAIRSQVRPVVAEPAQPAIDTAAIYAARNHNAR